MAWFLALCITKSIDLCLLPPHTSHVTQPLDLSIFSPLKTYLGGELDRIFRHSTSRIARVEFIAAYIQARERAFRPHSIESGFRKAGIYPFNPDIILNTLTPPLGTPPFENTTESQEVNLSQTLLEDPREGTPTPLDPDALYTQIVTDENLATPKRAFIKGLLGLAARKQAESSLLRKDLREKEVLLDTRRCHGRISDGERYVGTVADRIGYRAINV
jgi:hypothetical protein